jgi:hypothetical protein
MVTAAADHLGEGVPLLGSVYGERGSTAPPVGMEIKLGNCLPALGSMSG